jgi:hypothetical protein
MKKSGEATGMMLALRKDHENDGSGDSAKAGRVQGLCCLSLRELTYLGDAPVAE